MKLDAAFQALVRDALEPMITEALHDLEDRLLAQLDAMLAEARDEPGGEPDRLLTQRDVADVLRVDVRTVWRLVEAGELPRPIPITERIARWRRTDLDAALDARRKGARG